ncbi:hypothetical protein RB195_021086 [Necator americanus]
MKFPFVFWLIYSTSVLVSAKSSAAPFVLLPSSFRVNASNTIVVAPLKGKHENVDILITVTGYMNAKSSLIFTKKYSARKTGAPHSASFDITNIMEKAQVTVNVQGHKTFECEVGVKPNLAAIHIHTDKPTYYSGETVRVRALPLTYEGVVYDGMIEFILVNPDGFELVKKCNRTSQDYIGLTFELPKHLFYGDWRVLARPQGINDKDTTYDVIFQVKDYVLPPFKIIISISEGQPIDSTEIGVEARYYYGVSVSGSLTLYCSTQKSEYDLSKSMRLLQSQITDGVWQKPVNLSACFSGDHRRDTIISVEIRDKGKGSRGESAVILDPLAPGFEIVPLRALFNERTKDILITTNSNGATNGAMLGVTFHCLGDVAQSSKNAETYVGEVFVFPKPTDWVRCHVIMVQAARHLGTMKSRTKTMMLPKISEVPSMEPSWIAVSSPRAEYVVGETMEVTLPKAMARSLNYFVLCNGRSTLASGQIRNDGILIIEITTAMTGRCILFVYTLDNKPTTDMIQFTVIERCQATTLSSHNVIKPGSSVTFTLNGDPHGIAFMRAMDDRLNVLEMTNDAIQTKIWDFGMFHRPELKGDQAKLLNFVAFKEVKKALVLSCSLAASSYFQRFGKCPDAQVSQSALSNFCSNVMLARCMNPEQPTVAISTACDPKNPRNCGSLLRKTSSTFEHTSPVRADLDTKDSFVDLLSDDFEAENDSKRKLRERFHQVWLFDTFSLGASGTISKTLKAPDTVGKWSVSSVFWTRGQHNLCWAPVVQIISKKDIFLEIDVPKSVFVNETITAKVSVIAQNLVRERRYSVCLSDISRKICVDLGSFGQLGQPSYSRVVVSPSQPIDTKTFTLKFLSTGLTTVMFQLREETTFPGKHHCELGEVYDSVRLSIFIARRDETEDVYKRLIIDTSKSLNDVKKRSSEEDAVSQRDIFHVVEYSSPLNADVLITDVHTNVPDADAVYSFTIDISSFLPLQPLNFIVRRNCRSLDCEHAFLSDVLKQLSVELYQFKRINMFQNTEVRALEASGDRIGSLISDMLRFSDCRNESTCGYSEYMAPRKPEERSIALTAIATSLLCESSSDSHLICGGIRFLIQSFMKEWKEDDIDLRDLVYLVHAMDREWFVKALLLQVSRDCAVYQCVKDDDAWFRLLFSFYSIDENWKWDIRSLAALAYMGTNATSEVMRIKMAGLAKRHMLPYWNAAASTYFPESNSLDYFNGAKRAKSNDVLVNALGILAFVSVGAEGRNVDWDPLANWLYEQQFQDGTYENAIDTYFASRALFEYRFRKVGIRNNEAVTIIVRCTGCETRTVNVNEAATEIYLPAHTRHLTLESKGHGKVMVGMRLVARKRQRSRRGLTQDDYYPVRISVTQERVYKGAIRQTVCLRVLSPLVKIVELTHGLYTGYSAASNNISILPNSTSLTFVSLPIVSSFAAHFVLNGFQHNKALCYAVGVTEPEHSHEPFHLAPVAITARHPVDDVIGLALISHPDQNPRKRRDKRQLGHKQCSEPDLNRNRREITEEFIDTVCFQGGQCSCAESTCGVKCGFCARDSNSDIKAFISEPENFGAFLRVQFVNRVLIANSFYTHLSTEVREKRGEAKHLISEKLGIWLRECNPRCVVKAPAINDSFFLLGEASAISVDGLGVQQYVLRSLDRFERATEACTALASVIVLS